MRTGFAVAGRVVVVAALMSSSVWAARAQNDPPKGAALASVSPADDKVIADFQQRVKAYLDVVKQAEAGAPKDKPKQNIDNLDARRKELALRVKARRSGAKQGDIFMPEAATLFRQLIAKTMTGPNGARIRASLRHAEPLLSRDVQVSESYPNGKGVPLQSTPPSLLMNLPVLPQGVEYRVMDHALLLRDTEANIVVDYLPDAFPK